MPIHSVMIVDYNTPHVFFNVQERPIAINKTRRSPVARNELGFSQNLRLQYNGVSQRGKARWLIKVTCSTSIQWYKATSQSNKWLAKRWYKPTPKWYFSKYRCSGKWNYYMRTEQGAGRGSLVILPLFNSRKSIWRKTGLLPREVLDREGVVLRAKERERAFWYVHIYIYIMIHHHGSCVFMFLASG